MARIYVASSWRNPYQPEVVAALRKAGHEVYDFRNPEDNPGGFHWADTCVLVLPCGEFDCLKLRHLKVRLGLFLQSLHQRFPDKFPRRGSIE